MLVGNLESDKDEIFCWFRGNTLNEEGKMRRDLGLRLEMLLLVSRYREHHFMTD